MSHPAPLTDDALANQPFLSRPLTKLLGTKTATALTKLGLTTAQDLLWHTPRRYAEPGRLTNIGALTEGEHVTVMARIHSTSTRTMRSRSGALLTALVTDDTHTLTLAFFARSAGALRVHESKLQPGRVALFTGTVRDYRGERQLTHPDYIIIGIDATTTDDAIDVANRPIPIYPATAGVPTWRIERAVATVLGQLTPTDVPDPLPATIRERDQLPTAYEALRMIHQPHTDTDWRRARHRMRIDEAFVIQTALIQRRHTTRTLPATARPHIAGQLADTFDATLPYPLTQGQRDVGADIATDLASTHPMQRLLQGDVGSGKTLVALRAMLQVIDNHGQAVLLAPTEVLATQHAATLTQLLGPLANGPLTKGPATTITLLTGSLTTTQRKRALLDIASGMAGIIIGTHAVLSDNVHYADLGLVIVDEQHRFGVHQRDTLRTRGTHTPHMLVMTATPIPRTVAMTVFGDLDISTLTDMPAGRAGITTHRVPANNPTWMSRVWQRAAEEIHQGRQVYVVCPRINDTEPDPTTEPDLTDPDTLPLDNTPTPRTLASVTTTATMLANEPALAGVRIGVLHGGMSGDDKDAAMVNFADHTTPLLVATTVIEVGVNVPTASTMIILDADRFGISQLHQLRGRVGRGTEPGLCLLVADTQPGTPADDRLNAVASTTDGFDLAARDLELRREGDVLGATQSGRGSSLKFLRVITDADLIATAREDAITIVTADPTLTDHPELAAAVRAYSDAGRDEYLDRA